MSNSRMFPVVVESWTEHDEGGFRPDGVSVHLTMADCKTFVAGNMTNSDHHRPSGHPTIVDVPESLYERLRTLRSEGVVTTGFQGGQDVRWRSRGLRFYGDQAQRVLEGGDPFVPKMKSYDVVVTYIERRQKTVHASRPASESIEQVQDSVREFMENDGYEVTNVRASESK